MNIPGKSAPQIDLETRSSAPADASSTMTRRTLKLQGLAGLAAAPKPAAAPQTAAPAAGDDDTRTRRTVKLSSLAAGPAAVKPLSPAKPVAAPAAAPAAEDTMTRRTQKLTALDTNEVAAMKAADLTKPAVKLGAVAAQPAPAAGTAPRQTVKVDGIAPAHTPVIDLDAKVGDTNTRKTVKIEVPASTTPEIDLNATSADDTRTKKATKIAPEQFKSSNVDDTVKLQRPAPKPAAAPAPAAQPGGIKLNKPAAPAPKLAIPKPAASAPAPAPAAPAPAPAAPAAPAAAENPAEPTGNLGKNQEPPKEKKGLKVNTDALKDLGSAPMVQGDAPASVVPGAPVKVKESAGLNVSFAIFGTLAALLLIFIALVAVTDYFNIWQPGDSGRVDLPIISEHVYSNITTGK